MAELFRFLSVEEVEALKPPPWLIDGILPGGAIAVLYGAPNTGKTFVGLSMALSVATGTSWLDRDVDRGPVIYVATEGLAALGLRTSAWRAAHTASKPDMVITLGAVSLRDRAHVAHLLSKVRADKSKLVVLDTYANLFAGIDENKTDEVSMACAELRQLTNNGETTVLLIHHSGKDESRGMRGSSALIGAVDCIINLADTNMGLALECQKQRDYEQFSTIGIALEPVTLECQSRSCVVVAHETLLFPDTPSTPEQRLSAHDGKLLAALAQHDAGLTATELQKASGIPEGSFYRVLKPLLARGLIVHDGAKRGSKYRLTDAARRYHITIG